MVSGDGHGHREFRRRQFGHREQEPGYRRLKAERLTPERLASVAVTRHLE
jgi:predicted NACHT family NTPase